MKALPWIIAVCATTLCGHFYLYTSNKVEVLEKTVELSEKARSIEADQVRDLMFALQETKRQNDQVETRAFVSGVVDSMQRPEHYQKIWHAGYDRGTEVQRMADATTEKKEDDLGY